MSPTSRGFVRGLPKPPALLAGVWLNPPAPEANARCDTTYGIANVTLVEYGDYECPYCALAFPNLKRLQKRLAKELRFVFRHFPLHEAHPFAVVSAPSERWA